MSDLTNTIVHPEPPADATEPQDDIVDCEDQQSTSSTTSISKQSRQCPFCPKEMQTRYLFKHICNHHAYQLLCSMSIYKENEMATYAVTGNAYPFEYSMTNDFDEIETFKIYGCLGCKNTFTNEARGNTHCENKKCKVPHIKGIKKMIKDEKESKKKPIKQDKRKTVHEMKKIVEMEMRRYKHLCVVSQDLQDLYNMLQAKQDSQTEFDDTKLYPITQFASVDYKADTDAGVDGLEKQFRLWARRWVAMEDKYVELRDYLYHYSSSGYIDRYKAMSYENPDRIFVGCSNHDAMGESKYPLL